MFEEEKKRLKVQQKNYREIRKSQYNNCDIIIKWFFNCDIITNKILFNYDLIKHAIQPYIIKSLYSYYFRQTDRNKSLIIHN